MPTESSESLKDEGNFLYLLRHLSICLTLKKQAAGLWSIWCWCTCTQSHSLVHAPNQELRVWADSTEGKLAKQWRPHAQPLCLLSWAKPTVTAVCRLDSLCSYCRSELRFVSLQPKNTKDRPVSDAVKCDFCLGEYQSCSCPLRLLSWSSRREFSLLNIRVALWDATNITLVTVTCTNALTGPVFEEGTALLLVRFFLVVFHRLHFVKKIGYNGDFRNWQFLT